MRNFGHALMEGVIKLLSQQLCRHIPGRIEIAAGFRILFQQRFGKKSRRITGGLLIEQWQLPEYKNRCHHFLNEYLWICFPFNVRISPWRAYNKIPDWASSFFTDCQIDRVFKGYQIEDPGAA